MVDATLPTDRPRVQGGIDVLIAVTGATGGAVSGLLMSVNGYGGLAFSGSLLSLVLLPALLWSRLLEHLRLGRSMFAGVVLIAYQARR